MVEQLNEQNEEPIAGKRFCFKIKNNLITINSVVSDTRTNSQKGVILSRIEINVQKLQLHNIHLKLLFFREVKKLSLLVNASMKL
jgi:hypothetical protein